MTDKLAVEKNLQLSLDTIGQTVLGTVDKWQVEKFCTFYYMLKRIISNYFALASLL